MNEEKASVAVLVNGEGKVLIILRSDRVASFRGFWCFPGGAVEAGEALDSAAARECKEETNLTVKAKDLIFIGEKFARKVNVTYFVTDKYSGSIKLNSESTDYKWIEPEDLDDTMMIPLPQDIILSIINYCRN